MAGAVQTGEKRRWLIAATAALVVFAGLVLLFRFPAPVDPVPITAPAAGKSAVQLARPGPADELLRQETELRDPRPLFLPTSQNAALREPRREPGRTLLDDENVKLKFAEAELHVERELPPIVTLNGRAMDKAEPVDALAIDADFAAFAGFGRRAVEVTAFSARGGFVSVAGTRDGASVLGESLPPGARPSTDKAWSPVEFFAAVDATGLTMPLVVTEGSRVEEVDVHFRKFLTRDFRIGARLAPGFYRITVAP